MKKWYSLHINKTCISFVQILFIDNKLPFCTVWYFQTFLRMLCSFCVFGVFCCKSVCSIRMLSLQPDSWFTAMTPKMLPFVVRSTNVRHPSYHWCWIDEWCRRHPRWLYISCWNDKWWCGQIDEWSSRPPNN